MSRPALLALALALAPRAAWACAVCLDSAFGDRSFNWTFVGLMLAPFAVAGGLAAVLVSWRGRREAHAEEVPTPHSSDTEVRTC